MSLGEVSKAICTSWMDKGLLCLQTPLPKIEKLITSAPKTVFLLVAAVLCTSVLLIVVYIRLE